MKKKAILTRQSLVKSGNGKAVTKVSFTKTGGHLTMFALKKDKSK